ncbi:MAG: hypothetical protein P8P30_09380 [Rickettsiales bacterium]|nr:hypothetical protein [Rickettsiales bacterium]
MSNAAEIVDPLTAMIKQARSGDAVAAFKYAERLQRGLPGEKPNFKLAAHWFKISAQQGNADAAIILADMYTNGDVTPPTPTATKEMYAYGYRLLKSEAEKGRPSAATRLGLMFFHGQGVEPDANLAIKWLQRGVELGSPQAKLALGRLTIWNSTPGYTSEQALEMLHDAAEGGLGSAWLYIGLAYSGAFGGRINHPRAVEAFRMAHESGTSAEGTRQYGMAHFSALGMDRNPTRGAELIQKAAKRGNSEAMYNLALLYRHGRGVAKDKTQELKWLRKASDYKVPDADYYLALAHRDGVGVSRSKTKALKYFKRAQAKKHVLAIRDYNALAGKPKSSAKAKAAKEPAPVDEEIQME